MPGGGMTLGNLLYQIKTNNRKFKSDMKDNRGEIKDLDKTAEQSRKKMRRWGAAITAVSGLVVGAFVKMANESARFAEEVDKMASQTGMAHEEVAALGYAAEQELASMQQLATAASRLARNMSNARDGTGEAADTFEEFDIDVEAADDSLREIDDVIFEVSDIMADLDDHTRKTSIAMELFGRSGRELVPFLSQGSEGIREMMREAERLGITLSEENVQEFREYKDTVDAFRRGMQGLRMTLANEVLPVLQRVADILQNKVEFLNDLDPAITRTISQLSMLAAGLGLVIGPMMILVSLLPKIKAGLGILAVGFKPFLIGGAIAVGLAWIVNKFREWREEVRILNAEIETLTLEEAEKRLKKLEEERERQRRRAMAAAELFDFEGDWEDYIEDYEPYAEDWRRVNEEIEAAEIHIEEIEKAKKEAGEEPVFNVDEELQNIEEIEMEWSEAWNRMRQEAQEPIVDQVEETFRLRDPYKREVLEEYEDFLEEIRNTLDEEADDLFNVSTGSAVRSIVKAYQGEEVTGQLVIDDELRSIPELVDEGFFDGRIEGMKEFVEEHEDAYNTITEVERETMRIRMQQQIGMQNIRRQYNLMSKELSEDEAEHRIAMIDIEEKEMREQIWRTFDDSKEAIEMINDFEELYAEKREEIREEYADEAIREEERLKQRKYDLEEISLDDYRSYLESRLEEYEKYSDDWMRIYRELENLDEPETALNNLEEFFVDIGYEAEEAERNFDNLRNTIVDGFTRAITQGENLLDVLKNIADQFAQMVIRRGIVEPAVDFALGEIAVAHDGGYVSRQGMIQDIPRFHLGVDEVPAILQEGERVLSRRQNEQFEKMMKSNNRNAPIVIQATDAQSFVNRLKNNKNAIVEEVGRDILNDGTLKELIRQLG